VVGEGMSCVQPLGGAPVLCGGGTWCAGPNMVCVPPTADGASCVAGSRCEPPAQCGGPDLVCTLPVFPACN
jgi:hypothetical protein